MKFVPPKSFKLLGRTIVISIRDLEGDTQGQSSWAEGTIELRRDQTAEQMQHTFYHEMTHIILWALGRETLNDDEGLVDAIGGCLQQINNTMRTR